MEGLKAKRLLYVENDPALRALVAHELRTRPEIGEVFDFASGEEATEFAQNQTMDVALLDFSLGHGVLDGIATGIELRRLNQNLGIVIFSQHAFETVTKLINFAKFEGWSYLTKNANVNIDKIVSVLVATTQGKKSIEVESNESESPVEVTPDLMSPRQRLIIALLASGHEPKFIAERLGITVESVRKDLSQIYSILLPEATPGIDLRISSILEYQRLVRSNESWLA